MAVVFDTSDALATIAGTEVIAAIPADTTELILSMTVINLSSSARTFNLYKDGVLLSAKDQVLAIGGGFVFNDREVMKTGQVLTIDSDTDDEVSIEVNRMRLT